MAQRRKKGDFKKVLNQRKKELKTRIRIFIKEVNNSFESGKLVFDNSVSYIDGENKFVAKIFLKLDVEYLDRKGADIFWRIFKRNRGRSKLIFTRTSEIGEHTDNCHYCFDVQRYEAPKSSNEKKI